MRCLGLDEPHQLLEPLAAAVLLFARLFNGTINGEGKVIHPSKAVRSYKILDRSDDNSFVCML